MRTLFVAVVFSLLAVSCGKPDTVPTADILGADPSFAPPGMRQRPGQDFSGEKNFAVLLNGYPSGKPEPQPWAGFWWPYTANGIASGLAGGGSPAGKYDAARGMRTHSQEWEVANHGSKVPKVQGWWGHCNGWCSAAALFPEPRESARVNGITFSVADIKALITEAGMETSADFYGNRVDWANDFNSPKIEDTIPNQYFLVLTNYIGRQKHAVLIDRYTTDQIWNQPLVGYKIEYPKREDYLGADPSAPNVYRINVTSTIWWARDDVAPGVQTLPFEYQENEHFQARTLKAELWLDGPVEFDSNGKITKSGNLLVTRQGEFLVGGVWKNGPINSECHPDYMWVPFSILTPTDYSNPHLDLAWIRKHILSGGIDDPDVIPSPVPTPPSVSPTPRPSQMPIPLPSFPVPTPRPTPTAPAPEPTSQPTPRP